MQTAIKSVPCSLCHEPVSLETAKADHDGKAVHEDCYAQKLQAASNSGGDQKSDESAGS